MSVPKLVNQLKEAKELLKEILDEYPTTYNFEQDEICSCCLTVSYKGHTEDCIVTKIKKFLTNIN